MKDLWVFLLAFAAITAMCALFLWVATALVKVVAH